MTAAVLRFPADVERRARKVASLSLLAINLRDEIEDSMKRPVIIGDPPRAMSDYEWQVVANDIKRAVAQCAAENGIGHEEAFLKFIKPSLLGEFTAACAEVA